MGPKPKQSDPDKWRRKAEALARLAEDQHGTPEGDVARAKLIGILNKHPDLFREPFVARLTLGDLGRMKAAGISLEGKWEGKTVREATQKMCEDYLSRKMAWQAQQWQESIIASIFGVPPHFFQEGELVMRGFAEGATRAASVMDAFGRAAEEELAHQAERVTGCRQSALREFLQWQESYTQGGDNEGGSNFVEEESSGT